jgi:hypothetical protein
MSMLRRDFVLLSPVDVGPTKCGQVEFQTGEGYGSIHFAPSFVASKLIPRAVITHITDNTTYYFSVRLLCRYGANLTPDLLVPAVFHRVPAHIRDRNLHEPFCEDC